MKAGCHHPPASPTSAPLEADFQRYQYTQLHVGVQVKIILYAENEPHAEAGARLAFAELARLEDHFSDYRPLSEVRQLVLHAAGTPVKVSEPLFEVLAFSQRVSENTGGAFDVTAGPFTHLWRTARQKGVPPTDSLLRAAANHVGWPHLQLVEETRSVQLNRPGMLIDLGGVAKGYMLDRALGILAGEGLSRVLIEAGGDIVVGEPPPGRPGWRVTVKGAPTAVQERAGALRNAAIATSGDQAQFLEHEGRRYSHVIDPRTGWGLSEHIAATVIAPTGMQADAYATALTVMSDTTRDRFLARTSEIMAFVRREP